MGKRWREDITRTSLLNQPKGYSITFNFTLINKIWGEEGEGSTLFMILFMKAFVFPNNHYMHEALLPRKWLNISWWWELENFFFSFCFHAAFDYFFILITLHCLYLEPTNFFFLFLPSHFISSPPHPAEEGKWKSGCVVLSCLSMLNHNRKE